MTKQQQKRRRKRYQPGSAYAGDVRPTGVLGFMGSAAMIRIVFIGMALALAAGGIVGVFGLTNFGGGHTGSGDFVVQEEDNNAAATPESTEEASDVMQFPGPPEMTIDQSKTYVATIRTDAGDIQIELFADQTPETVNNFVFLARKGFYDETIFHFANPSFSVNAGDPACTRQRAATAGCDGGAGYELPAEATGSFNEGTLGMISETGSQFFIALTDSDEFARFTPFGKVTSGLDVARQLTQGAQIDSIEISEA